MIDKTFSSLGDPELSPSNAIPSILIVMGVSGCGKTTIGRLLSTRLSCSFIDADNFHPPTNVIKMSTNNALTDKDRWPWLKILAEKILEHIQQEQPMVLACSALKKNYRRVLSAKSEHVQFIYLKGNYDTITKRIQGRENHFMKSSLLKSQFAVLEEPKDAIVVDINRSPSDILAVIERSLPPHLYKSMPKNAQ